MEEESFKQNTLGTIKVVICFIPNLEMYWKPGRKGATITAFTIKIQNNALV